MGRLPGTWARGRPLEILTLKQAASVLGMSERTIAEYHRRGWLKGAMLGRRGGFRFLRADVLSFISTGGPDGAKARQGAG